MGKPFGMAEPQAIIHSLISNRLRIRGKYTGTQETADKIAAPQLKGNDEALLERIMRAIETRICDPQFNVEALSAEVGISRAHLHRKMKDLIGIAPADYIRNIRLRRACEMLTNPDLDISQIAFGLGFSSQSQFSTSFKKFTGVSPSEYRLRNTTPPENSSET